VRQLGCEFRGDDAGSRSGGLLGEHKSALVGEGDELRTAAEAKLAERPADVCLAVAQVTTRYSAISSLLRPVATGAITSRSRGVNSSSWLGAGSRGSGREASSWMTRRATRGDSTASPAATVRTAPISSAASTSFLRNPSAPARSDDRTSSSCSDALRIRTRRPRAPASTSRNVLDREALVGQPVDGTFCFPVVRCGDDGAPRGVGRGIAVGGDAHVSPPDRCWIGRDEDEGPGICSGLHLD
jgi:hypothetical protein